METPPRQPPLSPALPTAIPALLQDCPQTLHSGVTMGPVTSVTCPRPCATGEPRPQRTREGWYSGHSSRLWREGRYGRVSGICSTGWEGLSVSRVQTTALGTTRATCSKTIATGACVCPRWSASPREEGHLNTIVILFYRGRNGFRDICGLLERAGLGRAVQNLATQESGLAVHLCLLAECPLARGCLFAFETGSYVAKNGLELLFFLFPPLSARMTGASHHTQDVTNARSALYPLSHTPSPLPTCTMDISIFSIDTQIK